MNFLRQSTAVDIALGPFVDATDGVTPETALSITQAETRLKKNNGAWAQANDNTTATHEEEGWYEKELDATDTDTVGILIVAVYVAGALPVWREFQVVEEAIYDGMLAASAARIPADVTAVSGDTGAADTFETWLDDTAGAIPWLGILDQGTAQGATATTLVLRAVTPFGSDDAINGATLWAFGSTQGYWQSRIVTDYTTADDTATVPTWDVTPSGTITYKLFGTAPATSSGSGATAQEVWEYATRTLTLLDEDSTTLDLDATIRGAVGLAAANLDTQLGDLPTNAELATALGTADDAVLTAIAALNNVSVANILAATIEGSTTLAQTLRLLNAALGGKASGLNTTEATYRDIGDSKNRIVATVDEHGNRSVVTLDLT